MAASEMSATVLAVITGPPDAVVGVDLGGDDGYVRVPCTGLMYDPQVGDHVLLRRFGNQLFVDRCFTVGRTWQPLTLTLSASTPTDSSWKATSSVYARAGGVLAVLTDPTDPTDPGKAPPPPGSGSKTVMPVAAHTWDPSGWRTDDADPRQGSFGTGANKGLWFYGNQFDFLAGKSGVTATARIHRATRGGDPAGPGIRLQLWHHAYASQPAGEPTLTNPDRPAGGTPGRDDTVPVALHPATVAALVSGAALGIAISSDSPSDYLICFGPDKDPMSGAIDFSWSG